MIWKKKVATMTPLPRILLLVLFLSLSTPGFAETIAKTEVTPLADVPFQRLEQEVTRAAKSAGGMVGVCAIHIESGRRIALNSSERFPMASTYKIPIAVQLLARVDQ